MISRNSAHRAPGGSRSYRLPPSTLLVLPALLLGLACSASAPPPTPPGAVVVHYDEPLPIEPAAPPPTAADPGRMPVAAVAAEPETSELGEEADLAGRAMREERRASGELAPEALDSDVLLDQSLQTYESAQVFWQQGSFEDAFAALDRAYELMSQVPADGDSPDLAGEGGPEAPDLETRHRDLCLPQGRGG